MFKNFKILAAAGMLCVAEASNAQTHGDGWPALLQSVDPVAEAFVDANNLPGLSVAISVNGRLVLSRGYGHSLLDERATPPKATVMRNDHRVLFGSSAKALITGPSGYMALQGASKPVTTKLYGPAGIFGNKFNADIEAGVRRHYPIVAMAIAPDDKVHTWYVDGKYSVGTSGDLGAYQKREDFKVGGNLRARDIIDIAISKNGSVYTWYRTGQVSIGTAKDLMGTRGPADLNNDGMPMERTILNVAGIAINKSNDRVIVAWDDGTISGGTSRNFTHYTPARKFRMAGSSYDIRAIGISSKDIVYAWTSDGTVQAGSVSDLQSFRKPYAYKHPYQERLTDGWNPRLWYAQMTAEHLFNHTTGFHRSGDVNGAARMFGSRADRGPTYDQIHRYFLRTRNLLSRPGTEARYSNHGYGLWTLAVPALSGVEYVVYASKRLLAPAGLEGRIRPGYVPKDSKDAWPHIRSDGKLRPTTVNDRPVGLAAGGWAGSATDMIALSNYLTQKYSTSELDLMGWAPDGMRLWHNGARNAGGSSYIEFITQGGNRIHVAVATNRRANTNALGNLAKSLSARVGPAAVDPSYNLWD